MVRSAITSAFLICVAWTGLLLIGSGAIFVYAKLRIISLCQAASRVSAISQNVTDVQNEINITLQNDKLPTSYNGNTLFTVTYQGASPVPGQTGFSVNTGPSTPNATVTITYNVPIPFNKLLEPIGGPDLGITVPITETDSVYNETQYAGAGF